MRITAGWQSLDPSSNALTRVTIERRELREDDIAVRIDYCGVCHSDLHRIRGMLGEKDLVPGHEATGVVVATGREVTGFAVGERVAIGTIIDSCGECAMCLAGQENYCYDRPTTTYGGTDRIDGTVTKGAYSREYVLREKFAFHLPDQLDAAAAAPLMCAGVSVWEPLRAAGVGPGSRVAIAGLGGLGHLAVRLAAAFGAEVTVLSRSTAKAQDARALGAAGLLVTTDDAQVAAARGSFDFILDTISADHDLTPLIGMLGLDGTLCVLGNPLLAGPKLWELGAGRKKLTSSGTGGLRQTAEMLEFCASHGITADVETLPSGRIETALNRLAAGDVHYRFVLDMSDLDQ
ncbi:NAD(P)-dependent alcohol dehydrogenase [Streptomyces sp. NPDC007084]|uniref:NAD(P)-dependent alcohol dehydrogenase n=1 Tax=Streptomyces sp. NPDC007084 TaxID=3154313 RepID=UPI0034519696